MMVMTITLISDVDDNDHFVIVDRHDDALASHGDNGIAKVMMMLLVMMIVMMMVIMIMI